MIGSNNIDFATWHARLGDIEKAFYAHSPKHAKLVENLLERQKELHNLLTLSIHTFSDQ